MKYSPHRHALALALLAGLSPYLPAQAQTPAVPAVSAAASAADAINPNDPRLPLARRILKLWPIEDVGVVMVNRPAVAAMEQSRAAVQGRVVAEKQDRTLADIAKDVQKFIDEASPIAKESAHKLVEPTIVPLLLKNFSEEELKQIISLLESPVKKKFEDLVPVAQAVLGDKVAQDAGPAIKPKLQAMQQTVGNKLRTAAMTPQ